MGNFLRTLLVKNKKAISSIDTWKAVLAEMIGTSILISVGCGVSLGPNWEANTPTVVQISFAMGLTVTTMIICFGSVSGGYVNPAVTMAMMVTRKMALVTGILYIIAQLTGAIIGCFFLKSITPSHFLNDLAQTTVSPDLRPFPDGVLVEGFITFTLVFTVFASNDSNRKDLGGFIPLGIGLCVVFCNLFAIKYTGSCLNPARSFGPAVIGGNWENHWVYWTGPMLGSMTASLSYEMIFANDASIDKVKRFLIDPHYGEKEMPTK